MKTLTRPEVDRILDAADADDAWLRPLVEVAVNTGMRTNELLNLTHADVEDGTIRVPSPVSETRSVPLNGPARQALEEAKAKSTKDDPRIFPHTRHMVSRAFARACERAGLGRLNFHALRKTAYSWMVQSGVPLFTIMKILGIKRRANAE